MRWSRLIGISAFVLSGMTVTICAYLIRSGRPFAALLALTAINASGTFPAVRFMWRRRPIKNFWEARVMGYAVAGVGASVMVLVISLIPALQEPGIMLLAWLGASVCHVMLLVLASVLLLRGDIFQSRDVMGTDLRMK